MSPDELADQLASLSPAATETQAVVRLANAYSAFAADAVAGAVQLSAAGVAVGRVVMRAALVGISANGAGAAVLAAAVQTFWSTIAASPTVTFPTSTAVSPPPNAGLQVLLEGVFAANTVSGANLADAARAIATVLYNQAIIGGTATFPGPTVSPIL